MNWPMKPEHKWTMILVLALVGLMMWSISSSLRVQDDYPLINVANCKPRHTTPRGE
jgi:hypothetical protein